MVGKAIFPCLVPDTLPLEEHAGFLQAYSLVKGDPKANCGWGSRWCIILQVLGSLFSPEVGLWSWSSTGEESWRNSDQLLALHTRGHLLLYEAEPDLQRTSSSAENICC